ncbi:MAG: 60 kDa inner rane insertion protein [Frankiales bacterium]|nr:60 kDa inner rane insertion protein [Frankiales bacterium]
MNILDTIATPVAFVLKTIHEGLATFLPSGSGWAWGLSIVLLTITVRVALFPLFVKQIKSQRRMQELAPKMKELQAKHKGDRETLNVELMKLYKEHGTNPVSGCMPMLLQLPIFFALFRVMNEFKPHFGADGVPFWKGKYGLSSDLIAQGAHAKVFGSPISAAFNSSPKVLDALNGNAGTVKVLAVIMIVTMGLTTFLTQRQMMARNGPASDPQQAQIQKFMLYVLPFSFAIFGFSFPIGVLLYWLTTNLWSMGQQRYVISRMPVVTPGGGPAKPGAKSNGKDLKPMGTAAGAALVEGSDPTAKQQPQKSQQKNQPGKATGKGAAGSRKNKSKKKGRR